MLERWCETASHSAEFEMGYGRTECHRTKRCRTILILWQVQQLHVNGSLCPRLNERYYRENS